MAKASAEAIKAGEAFVELFADDSKFNQTLKSASQRFTTFVTLLNKAGPVQIFKSAGILGTARILNTVLDKVGSTIKGLSVPIAALGTGILAAFGVATYATLKYLNDINKIAEKTNSSTEAVSRIGYAARTVGLDLDKLEDSQKNLNEQIKNGTNGSEDQAAALRKIGMTGKQFASLPIDEQFIRLAEVVETLPNTLDRNRFLLSLFGEEFTRLLPLLNKGGAGLRALFQQGQDLGALIESSDAKAAAEALKEIDKVTVSLTSTIREVALSVLTLGGDAKETQRIILLYLKMFRDWVKENRAVVAGVVILVATITAFAIAAAGVGFIIAGIAAGISGLIAIVSFGAAIIGVLTLKMVIIAGIVTLLTGLIAGLTIRFFKFTETGKKVGAILLGTFEQIKETFTKMFQAIGAALSKGDLQLAMEVAGKGLEIAWQELTTGLLNTWYSFTNDLIQAFVDFASGVKTIMYNIGSLIRIALKDTIVKYLKDIDSILSKFDSATVKAIQIQLSANTDAFTKDIEEERKKIKEAGEQRFQAGDEFLKNRKDAQLENLNKRGKKLQELDEQLDQLNKKANAPIEQPAPGLPVAPFPRAKGTLEEEMRKVSDSAKGVFQSADFRGVLGIGGVNDYAKQAVDIQRGMLGQLQDINRKTTTPMFT